MKKLFLCVLMVGCIPPISVETHTPVTVNIDTRAGSGSEAGSSSNPTSIITPTMVEQTQSYSPADQTDFKGDGFEVSTPAAGWRQIRTPSTAILGLVNPELRNLIIVVTEPTKLNTVTMRDDVAAKLLKGSPHATVIPNSKKNSIKNNGITFASFRVGTKQVGSPMKGWVWTTVQNGKAVTLLCSGAEDSDKTQEKACAAAFKSLKLTTNGK